MKKIVLVLQCFTVVIYSSFSQSVGIGTTTPDPSSALDISAINKGLLIPRMNINSINAIPNPARGLLVYDSVANQLMLNIGTPVAPNWQPVASNPGNAWSLTGNGGIDPANQFLGTTSNQPLRFRINNIQAGELHPTNGNIFFGLHAGQGNTTGTNNIAIGTDALKFNKDGGGLVAIGDSALFNNDIVNPAPGVFAISNTAIGSNALFSNTFGSRNTATGSKALSANTVGNANSAYGESALLSNTTGGFNTAIGASALPSNITGNFNTSVGAVSLFSNTSGHQNTALGAFALTNNTTGNDNVGAGHRSLTANSTGNNNTALGSSSLFSNTTGESNTAIGSQSLFANTVGEFNTAIGTEALRVNTTGGANTAIGFQSLVTNTTGINNTALGNGAMLFNATGSSNVAIGANSLTFTTNSEQNTALGFLAGNRFNMGFGNTLIGANADASQDGLTNAAAIGAGAIVNASNKVRIGNGAVTVIEGQVPFTTPSDGRFKFNIKEDVKGLDFIMQLRPVTYQFDVNRFDQECSANSIDSTSDILLASYNEAKLIRRTGFIAQEVEKAAMITGYDFSGIIKPRTEKEHYGLSYESFVVPLVKAMQEQQQMINELKEQNAELKKINIGQKSLNEQMLKRIKELESSLNVKK
jgi:hypothetical protein